MRTGPANRQLGALRRVVSVTARLGAVALVGLVSVFALPRTVSACSGGVDFAWAVQHSHGGIIRAHVDAVSTRPDFTTDLVLSGPSVIRGEPSPIGSLHAVAGAVCEQSADPGETILVLFDIRGGDVPTPLPLFYVVEGPDALSPSVVTAALAIAPATDTAATGPASPTIDAGATGILASAAMAGALLASLRWRRSASARR